MRKPRTMKDRLADYLATLAPSKLRVNGPTPEETAQRFARYYLRPIGGGWLALPEGGTVAQGVAALWQALVAQGWAWFEDETRRFIIGDPGTWRTPERTNRVADTQPTD